VNLKTTLSSHRVGRLKHQQLIKIYQSKTSCLGSEMRLVTLSKGARTWARLPRDMRSIYR